MWPNWPHSKQPRWSPPLLALICQFPFDSGPVGWLGFCIGSCPCRFSGCGAGISKLTNLPIIVNKSCICKATWSSRWSVVVRNTAINSSCLDFCISICDASSSSLWSVPVCVLLSSAPARLALPISRSSLVDPYITSRAMQLSNIVWPELVLYSDWKCQIPLVEGAPALLHRRCRLWTAHSSCRLSLAHQCVCLPRHLATWFASKTLSSLASFRASGSSTRHWNDISRCSSSASILANFGLS